MEQSIRVGKAKHHQERRASARKFLAAVKNDPAAVPPVGTRVLKVDYDTTWDPMADITFEDGRTLSVPLSMTSESPSESPSDSDTEAWQKEELMKLDHEEMSKRIACRHLEKSSPPRNDVPEEVEIEGRIKIKILNSPGSTVILKVPDPTRIASRYLTPSL